MSRSAEDRIAEAAVAGSEELNLADTGLSELPASLRRLTGLTRLDLSYNALRELPPWLGELAALTEVDLNYNGLASVPPELFELPALRGLGLLGNRLTGLPGGLARLGRLRWLVLRGNAFAELPPVLRELTGLELLDVRHHAMITVPDWIGELTRLRHLDLADGRLEAVPAAVGALTELRRLDLRENRLSTLPVELSRLTRLDSLWLSGNRFAELPAAVRGLTGLGGLALRNNQLASLPDWIDELTGLNSLGLAGNRLTAVPPRVGRLGGLSELDLADNRLVDVPAELGDLGLDVLDLSGNPLNAELQAAHDDGREQLLSYLRLLRADAVCLREAKLILVGEGDVGKSCLLGALRGEPWQHRPTTHGIEIKTLDEAGIRLNGWDFSGQPEYRATHQLFFSAPAVYLVVWKPRVGPERSYVRYWIDLILHRVGRAARILVVATHGGPGEPAAFLDEEEIKATYGEMIVGFHHVDSRTGDRIDELRAAVGRVAAAVSGPGRWYPRTWLKFRDEIKNGGRPYLDYPDFLQQAKESGLQRESAALLARITDRLGHWITFTEDDTTALVVLQPDWLSRAISLILNDRETYDANGLLPDGRLPEIWGGADPYEPRLYRPFLSLMERYELSYRVADLVRHGESISLIGLRVPTTRPDLTAVWHDYRPGWEQASQICEITDAEGGTPGLPEGLMCQLIVRFHRYSLGRADVRSSVHWRTGMVLEDSYQGRALIEQDGHLIRVTVRGASPALLSYRLTDEIRGLIEAVWRGFRVRVMVPCRACPRPGRNPGLFDIAILLSSRGEDDSVRCLTCGARQRIDDLLHGVREARPTHALYPSEVRHLIRSELGPLADAIVDAGVQVERLAVESNRMARTLTARDAALDELLAALDDETRNGPWLAGIDALPRSVLKPGVTHINLRLSLWCEHAQLPLSVLRDDPEAGVYDLSLPRQWLIRAAPYLKVGMTFLRTFVPIVPDGLDGVLSEAGRAMLGDQLKAAGESLEPILDEADSPRMIPGAAATPAERSDRPGAAALRQLQQLIKEQDPTFAGLELVRIRGGGHRRYMWVDPRFAARYR
jgi:Leucine-rich repeat (LRR) protein